MAADGDVSPEAGSDAGAGFCHRLSAGCRNSDGAVSSACADDAFECSSDPGGELCGDAATDCSYLSFHSSGWLVVCFGTAARDGEIAAARIWTADAVGLRGDGRPGIGSLAGAGGAGCSADDHGADTGAGESAGSGNN